VEQIFDYLDAPPLKVTGKDVPMPYAAESGEACIAHDRRGDRRRQIGSLPQMMPRWSRKV